MHYISARVVVLFSFDLEPISTWMKLFNIRCFGSGSSGWYCAYLAKLSRLSEWLHISWMCLSDSAYQSKSSLLVLSSFWIGQISRDLEYSNSIYLCDFLDDNICNCQINHFWSSSHLAPNLYHIQRVSPLQICFWSCRRLLHSEFSDFCLVESYHRSVLVVDIEAIGFYW